MGVIAIYISMIFAELTSMFPNAGGVYEFCKNAFSSFWAFLIGWITFITSNITITMLIVGAIQYLAPQIPWTFKAGIAITFIFFFHLIAHFGMKTSATMLVAFAVITLGSVLLLIIPGLFHIDPGNYTPFFAISGVPIFLAILLIAETFFGWETATFLAGETKDGEKNVPKALVIGTVTIVILCLLLVFVSLGVADWKIFGLSDAPLSFLSDIILGATARPFMTIVVYLAMIGSVAGWIVAAPRLLLSMASDKLFIAQLAKIHPKHNSPYMAIWFQAIIVIILILVSSAAYETLLHLLLPLALLQYTAVAIALIILRFRQKERKRYFKAPAGIFGASAMIVFFFAMLATWAIQDTGAIQTFKLAGSLIITGIPIFFLLKIYYDPDAIIKLNDMFAYFAYVAEKLMLPKNVKKEILLLSGDLKGKTVLEYGCSIGTLTTELAGRVSASGKIFATNISAKELMISKRRIKARGHEHVVFIHDQHQANRIHPLVPQVDTVISFGMLSYIQDVRKVLEEMSDITKDGGNVIMVDWVNFFHIIPDVEWLTHDDMIREIFREAGFAVNVVRKKGLFWDYLYIHGIKRKSKIVYV
jgi:amino acid transporter/precorrin-6B methylase 2